MNEICDLVAKLIFLSIHSKKGFKEIVFGHDLDYYIGSPYPKLE